MEEEWMTTEDAAALSGYNIIHLRRLLRDQKVIGRKFGPLWQVSRSSLVAYLEAAGHSSDGRRGAKGRHQ